MANWDLENALLIISVK